jgi:hypothetical protein
MDTMVYHDIDWYLDIVDKSATALREETSGVRSRLPTDTSDTTQIFFMPPFLPLPTPPPANSISLE